MKQTCTQITIWQSNKCTYLIRYGTATACDDFGTISSLTISHIFNGEAKYFWEPNLLISYCTAHLWPQIWCHVCHPSHLHFLVVFRCLVGTPLNGLCLSCNDHTHSPLLFSTLLYTNTLAPTSCTSQTQIGVHHPGVGMLQLTFVPIKQLFHRFFIILNILINFRLWMCHTYHRNTTISHYKNGGTKSHAT